MTHSVVDNLQGLGLGVEPLVGALVHGVGLEQEAEQGGARCRGSLPGRQQGGGWVAPRQAGDLKHAELGLQSELGRGDDIDQVEYLSYELHNCTAVL